MSAEHTAVDDNNTDKHNDDHCSRVSARMLASLARMAQ